MSLSQDLLAAARRLVPLSCLRCYQPSRAGFCRDCEAGLARVPAPCPRCALPGPCHHCPATDAGWAVDSVLAPFSYTMPISGFIQALKYSRQRHLGRVLGQLLAAEIKLRSAGCDFIVPVPLHPRRLRERHFNQADEIARPIANALNVPLRPTLVRRTEALAAQAGLNRQQRWRSVRQAFSVARRIDGGHAVIVDDVMTTGATVNSIASQLKLAGAASVSAWAVARTVDTAHAADQPALNK